MDFHSMHFDKMYKLSLPEIQEGEYQILRHFNAFCNEGHLSYTLAGGTLLGAIRHKGFIPWDDDVDVNMPYPEFRRFIETYEREACDQDMELLYEMKRDCAIFMAKLVNKGTIVRSPGRDISRSLSLWIDVFPLFALSDNKEESADQLRIIRDEMEYIWKNLKTGSIGGFRSFARWLLAALFGNMKLKASLNRLREAMERYPYGSTQHVHSAYVYDNESIHPRAFPTSLFSQRGYCQFNDEEFPIPSDYDTYLRILYGPDYMTPPPPHERGGHCVEVYRLT